MKKLCNSLIYCFITMVIMGSSPVNGQQDVKVGDNFDIKNGLVLWLPFDDDTRDYSQNGNDGINHGTEFGPGKFGKALSFNGSSDYVSVPLDINPENMPQVTITAWAKADNVSLLRTVLSNDNGGFDRGLVIDRRGGGYGWSAFSGNTGVLGFHPAQAGKWTFVAVVYDQEKGEVMLYVDGSVYKKSGKCDNGFDYINIGKNPGFNNFFSGEIDEVRIYNYALTEEHLMWLNNYQPETSISDGDVSPVDSGIYPLEFGENLKVIPLVPLQTEYDFTVSKIPSISYSFPGAKSIGNAYRLKPEGVTFEAPVRVKLPINVTELEGEVGVISKDNEGNTSIIIAEEINLDVGYVTFLTTHFSDFEPFDFTGAYPGAIVKGKLYLTGNYEEVPTKVYFDFTAIGTITGEKANFVVGVPGISDYVVTPAIPDYLFGLYTFGGLVGCNDDFLFAGTHPYPTLMVNTIGGVYTQDIEVVATSSRLKGTVRNAKGEPVDGAKVSVTMGEGLRYGTKTRNGGQFTVNLIGLVFDTPTPNMTSTGNYLIRYPDEPCEQRDEGEVTLVAGKAVNQDFTISAKGAISGWVNDLAGDPLNGAKIVVTDTTGKVQTEYADENGSYSVEEIADGLAAVVATCPDGSYSETVEIDIDCQDPLQTQDFSLKCDVGYRLTFERWGHLENPMGKGGIKAEAEVLFTPDDNGMLVAEVPGYASYTFEGKPFENCRNVYTPSELSTSVIIKWQVKVSKVDDQYKLTIWSPDVLDGEKKSVNLRNMCGDIEGSSRDINIEHSTAWHLFIREKMETEPGAFPLIWKLHSKTIIYQEGGMYAIKEITGQATEEISQGNTFGKILEEEEDNVIIKVERSDK